MAFDFDIRIVILFAISAFRNVLFLFIILSMLQSLANLRLPDFLRPGASFIYDVCEPFLRVFRGLLPAVRLGGMGLDLSPLIAFVVLFIVERVAFNVLF